MKITDCSYFNHLFVVHACLCVSYTGKISSCEKSHSHEVHMNSKFTTIHAIFSHEITWENLSVELRDGPLLWTPFPCKYVLTWILDNFDLHKLIGNFHVKIFKWLFSHEDMCVLDIDLYMEAWYREIVISILKYNQIHPVRFQWIL